MLIGGKKDNFLSKIAVYSGSQRDQTALQKAGGK